MARLTCIDYDDRYSCALWCLLLRVFMSSYAATMALQRAARALQNAITRPPIALAVVRSLDMFGADHAALLPQSSI